jgi:long-subunit fatty acid transport protein
MKMYKNFIMRLFAIFMGMNMMIWGYLPDQVYGAEVEIPSSFNPVGSGARALGMGGAFIAVADDATAASWNPGGLTQLKKPECSVVGAFYHRGEDLTFGTNPEADGSHSISDSNINYLSASYPFEAFNHNMIVSLSYQHLYDFNRDWAFILKEEDADGFQVSDDKWEYEQTGCLTALGLSYAIRVIPQLSVGVTLNFWDDNLTPNNWEEKYNMVSTGTIFYGNPFIEKSDKTEKFSVQGFNYNIGFLWRINYKWTVGGVFKAPFKADMEHKFYRNAVMIDPLTEEAFSEEHPEPETKNEDLKLPMSYGIGLVYNISDNFSVSGDIYRTEWSDCVYKNADGEEISPITGGSASAVDPTHQIRIGGEYRFINKDKEYLIPIRAGIFYDPAPAEGSPDDFYGFAVGVGFSKNDWFSLDVAYQYRFGNDSGYHLMKGRQFSQDVDEHTVYLSMIWYRF